MKKIKCDVCHHWHAGFHLCVGPDANPLLRKDDRVYGEYDRPPTAAEVLDYEDRREKASKKGSGPKGRWERVHEQNRERDEGILAMYNDNNSLAQVGKHYGLSHPTIKVIVERMGGTLRPVGKNLVSRKKN